MTIQSYSTEIRLDISREALLLLAPDYREESWCDIFIDGEAVLQVKHYSFVTELVALLKSRFPGRFGYVKRKHRARESFYIALKGRLYYVNDSGEGSYVNISSSDGDEEAHKARVQEVKRDLESLRIPITKGVCTVTITEEC
jgi:hypothetical protein